METTEKRRKQKLKKQWRKMKIAACSSPFNMLLNKKLDGFGLNSQVTFVQWNKTHGLQNKVKIIDVMLQQCRRL